MKNRRILVVDDNRDIHADFRKILVGPLVGAGRQGLAEAEALLFEVQAAETVRVPFEVDSAYQGTEGLMRVRQALGERRPYALAFVDVRMPPGLDGIETTAELWKVDPDLHVVICTAHSDYSVEQIIQRLGSSDQMLILKKPFDTAEVLQLANALTEKWQLLQASKTALRDLQSTVASRTAELNVVNERLRREIDERKRAAEALQSTQRQLSHFLAASPVVIYSLRVIGNQLVPSWVSENLSSMLGWSFAQWTKPNWRQQNLFPEDQSRIAADLNVWNETGGWTLEYRLRHADESFRWIRDQARVLRSDDGTAREVVGAYTDVTELRQLEEQLRQSQKMEAIGQLAGGVAHDFNNLLTIIRSYAALALDDREIPARLIGPVSQIAEAADRAADLTRQLLAYSRRQVMRRELLNLAEVIDRLAKMLCRVLGEDISLEVQGDERNLMVQADRTMTEQIVLNLATNARDAMPHGGRLTIQVSTRERAIDDSRAASERVTRKYVCLTVADSGCGIDPEVLPHIFEPFYTTKAVGKGTGLGLATVYGIVKLHQGFIEVESQPGQGATFRILLPACEKSHVQVLPPVVRAPGVTASGSETVLLVEDEPPLRSLCQIVLERYGYHVIPAASGKEALEAWRKEGSRIDVLLTDLVMPDGMTGQELALQLKAGRPDLKVLFTSGYSSDLLNVEEGDVGRIHFMPKPYTPQILLEAVRCCIAGSAPTQSMGS